MLTDVKCGAMPPESPPVEAHEWPPVLSEPFGGIIPGARGAETGPDSDIDLAVIARSGWDDRVRIEDAVRTRLGNECDVL